MQPYFLPYIGYYQLAAAVDKFVILDDVNFIKRGWINRNTIVRDRASHWMTIPLTAASQNVLIRDLDIAPDDGWKCKLKTTVDHAYRKAPMFDEVSLLFHAMLDGAGGNLSNFLVGTLGEILGILHIKTQVIPTSGVFHKGELRGQARIIQICKELDAGTYVNLPGGRQLYQSDSFQSEGIELCFLEPTVRAGQIQSGLQGSLHISILDLLMRNPIESLIAALQQTHISE